MEHPNDSLPCEGGWDARNDERPHSSFAGRLRQPASTPGLEPVANDIALQYTGAFIFDDNFVAGHSSDGLVDTAPQNLQSFNEEVFDEVAFLESQTPDFQGVHDHAQQSDASHPALNIQPPVAAPWFPGARVDSDAVIAPAFSVHGPLLWPSIERNSQHSVYDHDGLTSPSIGATPNLRVRSHHSQSDRLSTVETTSQISNDATEEIIAADLFSIQPLTIGELSVCSLCRKRFSGRFARGNCARHIRNTHLQRSTVPDRKLICQKCKKVFKRQDATRKHEKRKHGMHQSSPPRRRSDARSTSHQTNDNRSEHGTSAYSESLYEPSDVVVQTGYASQQCQMSLPQRTRTHAPNRRTSQQSIHADNHARGSTAQQLYPRQHSLQLPRPPITGAADFKMSPNQPFPTIDMAQIAASDPGTHLTGQDMFSNEFSPYLASSNTSFTPVSYLATDQNTSKYGTSYSQALPPPSPYNLDAKWLPMFDDHTESTYPQHLPSSFTDVDFNPGAHLPQSPNQYNGFPQGSSAL